MKVPNHNPVLPHSLVSLSRLQNEGSQLLLSVKRPAGKSIKATE